MTWLLLTLHVLLITGFGLRILLRRDMRPDVRLAWLLVMVLLPYVSCALYYFFGEVALGRVPSRKRLNVQEFCQAHGSSVAADRPFATPSTGTTSIPARWQPAFRYASSINGFEALPGHLAELMRDGDHARAQLIADMDAAQREINVLYYIWLEDETGTHVAQALMRAAQRGVTCRAMVDGLGSRALVRSPLWKQMQQSGVHLSVALPINRPLTVMLTSRLDLRNHRKITLIDERITYIGSQNCADEAFRVKPRYAPWIDIMLRMQGPVVAQMQQTFASDWAQSQTTVEPPSIAPAQPGEQGFHAIGIAEGPTERPRATPQLVANLLAGAHHEVVISTPYFVPDTTVLDALCSAALRDVQVTLILPARNDSWIVGAVSHSHYWRLLRAGVQIHEFQPGLLHAKTLCLDGEVSFIGSTNLDLRSFDLNFENNVLLYDTVTTQAIRKRQQSYIQQSQQVTLEQVMKTPMHKRIWSNLLSALSPVL